MASSLLSGAENLKFISSSAPIGLGFVRSSSHVSCFPKRNLVSYKKKQSVKILAPRCALSSARPASQPRFIQYKQEAFWFYRFLSIVYDHIINPCHWTEDTRDEALEPADLYDRNLIVVDVGGGTGFTTLGIVKHVDAKNVTILDQSPHQLAKAKEKESLKECKIIEGDAEDLPFPTDYAHRYAGSLIQDVKKPINLFIFLLQLILRAMAASYYVLVPIFTRGLKIELFQGACPYDMYGGKLGQC